MTPRGACQLLALSPTAKREDGTTKQCVGQDKPFNPSEAHVTRPHQGEKGCVSIMQNRVLVLDKDKRPLDPCPPARARKLLKKGRASVYRRYPFTIILHDRVLEESIVHPHRVKVDPGSRVSGMVVVAEHTQRVVFAAEVEHRGLRVKAAMDARRAVRCSRRSRKTRYREARFLNRTRPTGWLPPSLESRVANIETWVRRLMRHTPISSLSMELVRFDTQKLENPEISGVEYQQGTLAGYEVKEYLLEKWGRACAYCDARDVPLEVDHIHPRSRGGANRVSNLTLACRPCNQAKSNRDGAEFVKDESRLARILEQAKAPLQDVAAVNATRWRLYEHLRATGLIVEVGTGGRTKFNRCSQAYPKAHWIDAACVGASGQAVTLDPDLRPLRIKAVGHGSRQMAGLDKYGFPKRHKTRIQHHHGFASGDIVTANVPTGKKAGRYTGKVAVRAGGYFNVRARHALVQSIHHRHCRLIHRKDGYAYAH